MPDALQLLSFGSDNKLVDLLRELVAQYKQSTAGKSLTTAEVIQLFTRAVTGITGAVLENFPGNATEAAKLKSQILEAVSVFYDEVIAPIDIKGIPNLVEGWVDRFARGFAVDLAAGLVDQLLALLIPKPDSRPADTDTTDGDQDHAKPLHNVVGKRPEALCLLPAVGLNYESSLLVVRMREFASPL